MCWRRETAGRVVADRHQGQPTAGLETVGAGTKAGADCAQAGKGVAQIRSSVEVVMGVVDESDVGSQPVRVMACSCAHSLRELEVELH